MNTARLTGAAETILPPPPPPLHYMYGRTKIMYKNIKKIGKHKKIQIRFIGNKVLTEIRKIE
jgi:hypothetical protein